ncbi:MAG: 2-C-methyl-D-erythritol 4-phosphate cytidylyltransferase [Clostridia bacterium]|nr:2-C-methyl-D-erythritol 4-phosphate cytidylyltransferase [Clostridia bacterium]
MNTKFQKKTASAIIVAAGDSRRMGNGVNKQLLLIDNTPVLAHTIGKFESANSIDSICIVTKPENIVLINDLVKKFGFKKVKSIVPGGKTRQQSVISGLKQIESNSMVAIHDGARPFPSSDMIDKIVSAAYEYGAAAPGVVPKDTVKVSNTDSTIKSTPDRSTLRLIQTPQVFNRDELLLAYLRAEESGFCATDDCSVIENMGKQIHIIEGEYTNIKVTTPEDIPIAEGIYNFLKINL